MDNGKGTIQEEYTPREFEGHIYIGTGALSDAHTVSESVMQLLDALGYEETTADDFVEGSWTRRFKAALKELVQTSIAASFAGADSLTGDSAQVVIIKK